MTASKSFKKLEKWILSPRFLGFLLITGVVSGFLLRQTLKVHLPGSTHQNASVLQQVPGSVQLWSQLRAAFASVHAKIEDLRGLEEDHHRLALENKNLKVQMDLIRFERNLAQSSYSIPKGMSPEELQVLGFSHFKAREDQKAALILSFLMNMENDRRFRTSQNLLITGIASYRINQLASAQAYFDEILKPSGSAVDPDVSKVQQQARLWKVLVLERLGKHVESQASLQELLTRDPQSIEATWVNGLEPKRATASKH